MYIVKISNIFLCVYIYILEIFNNKKVLQELNRPPQIFSLIQTWGQTIYIDPVKQNRTYAVWGLFANLILSLATKVTYCTQAISTKESCHVCLVFLRNFKLILIFSDNATSDDQIWWSCQKRDYLFGLNTVVALVTAPLTIGQQRCAEKAESSPVWLVRVKTSRRCPLRAFALPGLIHS